MQIETINEILTDAISKASKISTKNPQIPVLEYILFEVVDESTLKVTGYNLDIYFTQEVFIKTQGFEGKTKSICIQGNLLLSYLGLFSKDEKVVLVFSDKSVKIQIQNQESSIHCISSLEYPKNPVVSENDSTPVIDLELASDVIIDGIQAVSFAAAIASIKPELSSVMLSVQEGSFVFVATDGFRLAEKKIAIKGVGAQDEKLEVFKQVLIPAKILQDSLKVMPAGVSIKISLQKGLFVIMMAESIILIRTISGSYPNYKAILPKTFITHIEMDSEEFMTGLRASNLFSDEFNYVKIDIQDGEMLLSSKNSKIGESLSKKTIKKTGESITQSYNHRYLSDFVGKAKGSKLNIDISGKSTPTILTLKEDPSYVYLVMPMNK